MPRIRTVKPDFFRHTAIQECEKEVPYSMIVYAGLWGHCDRAGNFRYRPEQLHLDILPFIEFDMVAVLNNLKKHGFIVHNEGDEYAQVPTLPDHQRFTGKEAREEPRYYRKTAKPRPAQSATTTDQPNPVAETITEQKRETKGNRKGNKGETAGQTTQTPTHPPVEQEPQMPLGTAIDRPNNLMAVTSYMNGALPSLGVRLATDKVPHEAEKFYNYYQAQGWHTAKGAPVTDWQAVANLWLIRINQFPDSTKPAHNTSVSDNVMER